MDDPSLLANEENSLLLNGRSLSMNTSARFPSMSNMKDRTVTMNAPGNVASVINGYLLR